MFTFSREFLDVFDGRLADLLAMQGRPFIAASRAWLNWLEQDPRTALACDQVHRSAETARRELGEVVAQALDRIAQLRQQLERAHPALADRPTGVAPGVNTPGSDPAGALERFTFREFDRHLPQVRKAFPPRLSAWEVVTDPLADLRQVLSAKRYNFLNNGIQNRDGSVRSLTSVEARERMDALGDSAHHDWEEAYRSRIEQLGLAFYASAARSLLMLFETLRDNLTECDRRPTSWFDETPRTAHGRPAGLIQRELAESMFDAEYANRRESMDWVNPIPAWETQIREWVTACGAGLRALLSDRALLVTAVDRFRLRSERHDVERLREVAARTAPGGLRQAELRLTAALARYLFDAGFDVFTEVPAGQGRADLVQLDAVYLEAKQCSSANSERQRLIDGYREAMDGVRQFTRPGGLRAALLAVYVLNGPLYSLPEVIRGSGIPTYPVVIDLRLAHDRGAAGARGAVEITEGEFLAG